MSFGCGFTKTYSALEPCTSRAPRTSGRTSCLTAVPVESLSCVRCSHPRLLGQCWSGRTHCNKLRDQLRTVAGLASERLFLQGRGRSTAHKNIGSYFRSREILTLTMEMNLPGSSVGNSRTTLGGFQIHTAAICVL